ARAGGAVAVRQGPDPDSRARALDVPAAAAVPADRVAARRGVLPLARRRVPGCEDPAGPAGRGARRVRRAALRDGPLGEAALGRGAGAARDRARAAARTGLDLPR